MNNYKKFETTIGGKPVIVETGKYAYQSNGSCFVRCGDTVVMVNVTMNKKPRDGQDFFPLGVDFEEKMYAVGKIPGGFKKREGRPADQAILTSRLIDRPLRPLFPKGFFNDVAIVATALSVDTNIAPEPLAMFGSSVALTLSDIPFSGPTGSAQVGCIDGKFIINPTVEEREKSTIDLTVSGTKDAILMVEAGAQMVSEEVMLQAILFAHEEIKRQVEFQLTIAKELGIEKNNEIEYYIIPTELENAVREYAYDKMVEVMKNFDRHVRERVEDALDKDVLEHFSEVFVDSERQILDVLYKIKKEIMRSKIINENVRPDGRKLDEIRKIWCEVGILPRVHG